MKKTIHKEEAAYVAPEIKITEFSPRNMLCISNNLIYGAAQEAGNEVEYENGGSF